MHHLLEHINQDITSKDNDSTVNKTEYRSKRNPQVNPGGPGNSQRIMPLPS